MKKSSAWKMVCIVLMFCAAAVINSPAQTLVTLYSFCAQQNCADGDYPRAGLVQATDGNFYGTTYGTRENCQQGCGTVFKLTPQGTLTTLHSFSGGDGANPWAGLVQATDGNFYGTTFYGGTQGFGTVFKITPSGTLTTLHSFDGSDGAYPEAGLVQATDGNFYGTTGWGTVFKITPSGTLTPFCSLDGPPNQLVQATDGNFYGTTSRSGDDLYGSVFKITSAGTPNHAVQLHRG